MEILHSRCQYLPRRIKNVCRLLLFITLSAGCSSDSIVGGTHLVKGHLMYTDAATGINWLYDNTSLGGGTDYYTAMQKISALGENFRAPDLREFLISFDYDHPDHVLSHLPIELERYGTFYHTANLRRDGNTLFIKVDNGDVSKRGADDGGARTIAVYGESKIQTPSFRDTRNGTIEIPELRLYALQDHVDCFGQLPPQIAMQQVARLHDGMCGLQDGSSPGDWRMPTMKELALLLGDVDRGGGDNTHALPQDVFPKRGVWYGSSDRDADGNFWNLYLEDHPMGYLGDAGADVPEIAVWVLAVRPK